MRNTIVAWSHHGRDESLVADATSDTTPEIPAVIERCPRCAAVEPMLKLLTSITRYMACRQCEHRWPVAVVPA
jgi:hypothetical protein